MQVNCHTSERELAALAPSWNRLARGVAFRTWEWQNTWWGHYGGRQADGLRLGLFVLSVRDPSGELIGVAPWMIARHTPRGNVVRFLGVGSVCSEYLTLLCRPEHEAAVAQSLAEWMWRRRTRCGGPARCEDDWDLLELKGVGATDTATQRLIGELTARGAVAHQRPGPDCWRLELPQHWEAYLALLSKSHRKQLRRHERRLFDTGRAMLRTVASPAELTHGLRILAGLHERRQRSLGRVGCFASPRFAAFLGEVSEKLLATRRLRLSWLELDDRPIAAEYHLADDEVVYAYQAGIDPDSLADEPGRLATMATLRAAIDEGFRSVDFLRGDEHYKAHWRARRRSTLDIRVLPGRRTDWMRRGVWLAEDNVRSWLKAGRRLAWTAVGQTEPGN